MSDTLITIIAIFLAAILMFIFPLMAISGQNDEIAQVSVQTLISEFTNQASKKGKITKEDYEAFEQNLNATGNTYEIEIEAQILDDNVGKKSSSMTSKDLIGENSYYSVFTSTIQNQLTEKGIYNLKKGDNLIVKVKNTNITIGTQIKNFFYKIVGKDIYVIGGSASVLITNTGTIATTE